MILARYYIHVWKGVSSPISPLPMTKLDRFPADGSKRLTTFITAWFTLKSAVAVVPSNQLRPLETSQKTIHKKAPSLTSLKRRTWHLWQSLIEPESYVGSTKQSHQLLQTQISSTCTLYNVVQREVYISNVRGTGAAHFHLKHIICFGHFNARLMSTVSLKFRPF